MSQKSKLKKWQKIAKHDYSVHQDNLFWSRSQTLIAIQGGTLAGAYVVKDFGWLAIPMLVLGAVLTTILWIAAERDQNDRNQALEESEIQPLRNPPAGVGRKLMQSAFLLLLFADVWLLVWIAVYRGWLSPGAH